MAKILLIDASTEACSIALLNESEITEKYQLAPRQHASLLLPQIKQLLNDSDINLSQLDAIACNIGPGAFTGIRIAVSVAQGLAFGADLPAIGLSSLNNLAYLGAQLKPNIRYWLSAIDARMNEVYLGAYIINGFSTDLIAEPIVVPPNKIAWHSLFNKANASDFGLIGSGWRAYEEVLFNDTSVEQKQIIDDCFPKASCGLRQAEQYLQAGKICEPEFLQPMYLRNNVADKKK